MAVIAVFSWLFAFLALGMAIRQLSSRVDVLEAANAQLRRDHNEMTAYLNERL